MNRRRGQVEHYPLGRGRLGAQEPGSRVNDPTVLKLNFTERGNPAATAAQDAHVPHRMLTAHVGWTRGVGRKF
eukprot:3651995-Prymnesium_polylepis.1